MQRLDEFKNHENVFRTPLLRFAAYMNSKKLVGAL